MPWRNSPDDRRRYTATYSDPEYQRNRKTALERARYRCQIGIEGVCTGHATQVDHITPVSRGGTHHVDNLRAACGPCHGKKTAQEGRGFRSAPDPDPIPRTAW